MEEKIVYEVTYNVDYVLYNTKYNIDYIPTIEEYKLLVEKGYTQESTFSLGVPPLFILSISEDTDKDVIAKIEALTQGERIDGLDDMLDRLRVANITDSYEEYKVYYLAYLLAAEGILVRIEGQDYRDKLNNKKKIIKEYDNILKEGVV